MRWWPLNVKPNNESPAGDTDHFLLTEHRQILQLLYRVQRERRCIEFANRNSSFAAHINTIWDRENAFSIDEISPDTDARLLKDTYFLAQTIVDNHPLTFETHLVHAQSQDFVRDTLRFEIPARMRHPQFRGEHRVTTPTNWQATVAINAADTQWLEGDVHDLSPGGFSADFVNFPARYRDIVGKHLTFTLTLACDNRIQGILEVRYLDSVHFARHVRLGAKVIDLPILERRLLERSVAEIDRQQVRIR